MGRKLSLGLGYGCLALSGLNFWSYFSRPSDEVEALESASTCVQHYQGNDPQEALDCAQQYLENVSEERIPQMSELEQGIAVVRVQLGTNQSANQHLLDNLGELIENVADKYDRELFLFTGVVNILNVGLFFYLANLYRKSEELSKLLGD